MKLTELIEGIAKKTYRNRRVYPIDAAWAKKEFEKVDKKGVATWVTDAPDSEEVKPISWRRQVALIDRVQANLSEYGWTIEGGTSSFDSQTLVIWKNAEMQAVDLGNEAYQD